MFIAQISPYLGSEDFTLITIYWNSHFSQSHLHGENAAQISAAVAFHTVPISVPPGIQYCWVDRGGLDSKFSQGFNT